MGVSNAKTLCKYPGKFIMINGKKILALIPARGGSKGIKDKNIRLLNNQPLIAYTIQAADESEYVDDIIVTTDSERIAEIAKKYGAEVPFIRPEKLADDKAKTIDAVLHAIYFLKKLGRKYDILCLLQPTSPLRNGMDIDNAIKVFEENNEKGVVSVSEVNEHPVLMRKINNKGKMEKLVKENSTIRRQDLKKIYRVNGGIYINKVENINEKTSFNDNEIPYIMMESHSVDIDEMKDFVVAEFYLKKE